MQKCSYSDCNKSAKYKSPQLLCTTHYHQWWRKNREKKKITKKKGQLAKLCSVSGCQREIKYRSPKNLCASHYHSWWRKSKKSGAGKRHHKRGRPRKTENAIKTGPFSTFNKLLRKLLR